MNPYSNLRLTETPDKETIRCEARPSHFGRTWATNRSRVRRGLKKRNRRLALREEIRNDSRY